MAVAGAIIGKLRPLLPYRKLVETMQRIQVSYVHSGKWRCISLLSLRINILISDGKHTRKDLREIWQEGNQEFRENNMEGFQFLQILQDRCTRHFCSLRCPVLSAEYNGDPLVCGATPFFKKSLLLRTEKFLEHNLIKSI